MVGCRAGRGPREGADGRGNRGARSAQLRDRRLEGEGTQPKPPVLAYNDARSPRRFERLAVLRVDEERVRRQARELVEQHNLRMKVTEAEWQWDRNKLTLYFTAERRVDFRQLVRDLATDVPDAHRAATDRRSR